MSMMTRIPAAAPRAWDPISAARMKGVHPDLIRGMTRALQMTPFAFRIHEGLRTKARQAQLVAIGTSWTLNSRHLDGHAVDILPLVDIDRDGRIELEELYSWPLHFQMAPIVKAAFAAEGIPIEWGGDWRKGRKDGPHWQLPRKTYPSLK